MNNRIKAGIIVNAVINTKIEFPIIFPRKIRLLSVGVRRSPKIEFLSFSRANDRPRPKTPAKVKATQRMAGAAIGTSSADKSNAKLNIIMVKRAKVNIEVRSSFVLNSDIKSFQTIAQTFVISLTLYIRKVYKGIKSSNLKQQVYTYKDNG